MSKASHPSRNAIVKRLTNCSGGLALQDDHIAHSVCAHRVAGGEV
jgi:hypothetical protein